MTKTEVIEQGKSLEAEILFYTKEKNMELVRMLKAESLKLRSIWHQHPEWTFVN